MFVGVTGEIILAWTNTERKFKKSKKLFWTLIVVGLAYELIETAKSDRQVADINSTNILLSLRIEELRKANTELEAKLLPRRITVQQMKDFKFLTERMTKTPIKIVTVNAQEPLTYASDLREMFSYAGFKTNSDAGQFGINVSTDWSPVARFGQSLGETNVLFLNGKPGAIEQETWVQEITNGFARPIISTTNKFLVYAAIYECFRQIGIKSSKQGVTPTVAATERLIFVTEKQN